MTAKTQLTQPPPGPDSVYYAVHWLFNTLLRLLTRYELVGQENLPAMGGYLLTTNHMSFFDSVVIFINVRQRMIAFGADKWRHTPFIGRLMELMGVIWVARGEADVDALKAALNILKSGGRIGMAPEGTRSKDRKLHQGKHGAAYLASRAQVPIVPTGLAGTEQILSSWKWLRRPTVRCVIGKPYALAGHSRAKGAELDALTDEVMCQIAVLLPPIYRGFYAEHPRLMELEAQGQGEASTISSQ